MRRVLLKTGLLIALTAALALFALKYVFVIREIAVSGNDGIPAESVISASGLEPGGSMLRLNTEKVKNGISCIGSHALLRVEKLWPDGIELVLRPRERMAMALCTGGTAVLDGECIVMDVLPEAPDYDLIYISGLDVQGARIGQRLRMKDAQAEICTSLLQILKAGGADAYVSEIGLSGTAEPELVLKNGCRLMLDGDKDLLEATAWLKLLAQDLEHRGERGGVLMLNRAGCADYIPAE